MSNLEGKTIVIGITGGIAAYKIPSLVTDLRAKGANIEVIMTENATKIISPLVFDTLTGNRCMVDTFDRGYPYRVGHVAVAQKADVFIVAPASANTVAKIAYGMADNMLTTTLLACTCPKIIVPAMNTAMLENPVTQENILKLKALGYTVVDAEEGTLANGDRGKGRMPEPKVLSQYIEKELKKKDLEGLKITITAGPTKEALDPVRFISNNSTGKMGYALAKVASYRGAKVVLVSGPVDSSLTVPLGVSLIRINSAQEMFDTVVKEAKDSNIIIKAAAVADYRPTEIANNKIKKSDKDLSIELSRTKDILKYLGENKTENQYLCGFSMETENLIENSRAKLKKKNANMIVANSLKTEGAGFGTDTNVVTLITEKGEKALPIMSKEEVANSILDEILLDLSK
ncbi:MAG: bifunctional phosphopantothenoylcysteine decarboxylase/phosphopantothenate--cysteine ligase CoaBC [Sphaerochaetaceae bacterium]|nr:bifunctional phosphopantothenoylcysteine decarboxylase/phosphopantothenate--cysteine ligase CoaBC [Sphaerochaetaceae bacterium]